MTTYLFTVLIAYVPAAIMPYPVNDKMKWLMVLIVFITTFVIPAISLFILKLTHSISSLTLFVRKERIMPFFYTTIFYAITAYLFGRQLSSSSVIVSILGGTAGIILFGAIVTVYWKISAHAAGVGGLIGFLLGIRYLNPDIDLLTVLAIAIAGAGLVLASRLYLNAHTPGQVYAGFGMGVFVSFVTLYLF
jgi:membrane-associated phospholipid phosphatase